MLCTLCKEREATVHLTQIVGDKVQKVDLCEQCAKEKGVNDPTGFSLADLLLGLGTAQNLEDAAPGGEVRCPACGFTQADFKKAGRFGCPECYTAFAEGLEGMLKNMHKGTRHVGKVPQTFRRQDNTEHLRTLQQQLTKAIQAEQFEDAARLRDAIKSLQAAAAPPA